MMRSGQCQEKIGGGIPGTVRSITTDAENRMCEGGTFGVTTGNIAVLDEGSWNISGDVFNLQRRAARRWLAL